MSQVKFRSTLFKGLRVVGQSPTVLTLWGVSLKKARETAKRLSRPVAHRKGGFPKAGLRANACPLRPPLEGTSPKGGGEAWLCASFMAAHILGSPLGGAGTASAVTERARRYRPGKTLHCFPSFSLAIAQVRARPWGAGLTCRFGRRRAFATGKLRPTPRSF